MSDSLPKQWLEKATEDLTVARLVYIPTRYPDGIPGGTPTGMPSNAEAQEAIEAAEKILQFVTRQLS